MDSSSSAVRLLCILLIANWAIAHDYSSLVVPETKMAELWRYQVGPANSAFPYDYNSWPIHVSRMEQLWRYQVGPSGVRYGVTPGDDYICLRDWNGKFIRGTPQGPYNDRTDCFDHERFIVKFHDDDLVSLQRKDGKYLCCNKPNAGACSSVGETAKFRLLITRKEEDMLFLFNPYHTAMLESVHEHHLLQCELTEFYPMTFYGWKEGPKDSWRATDRWIVVGTYDNRESVTTGIFTYSKTVGTSKTVKTSVGAGTTVSAEAGASFGMFFSAKVSTTIGADWSLESSDTWSESTTTTVSMHVPPGVATTLYQAEGAYGIFTVKSNYFRAVDFDSNGNILSQRAYMATT